MRIQSVAVAVVLIASLVGCVKGVVEDENGAIECFTELDCPPGNTCAADPIDATAAGVCIESDGMPDDRFECTTAEDCPPGTDCIAGRCSVPDPRPDMDPNPTPQPMPDPQPAPEPTPQPDPVQTPCETVDDCEVFEECCEGFCVGRGTCEDDFEPGEPCGFQGQTCNLRDESNIDDQGAFYCVRLGNGETPVCTSKCPDAFEPSTCGNGTICWDLGDEAQPLPMCIPSDCTSSAQCTGIGENGEDGSCLRFENNVGLCFFAGTAGAGATCNLDSMNPADNCGVDLFCITPGDARIGTCRGLCDPWGASTCNGGQACGLLTFRQGVCLDQTITGRQSGDTCSASGDWCGDATECFVTGTPPNTSNLCLAYCRPDSPSDCAGERIQGQTTQCNTTLLTDPDTMQPLEGIGLCIPPQ